MPIICAVDPGVEPTMCVLHDESGKLLWADFYEGDDTSYERVVGGKKRRRPSAPGIFAALRDARPDVVVIEEVGAMPGESANGAFSFGYSRGLIEGVVHAMGLPLLTVRPQEWKKRVGIPAGSGKAHSRHVAASIAPNLAHHYKRATDHNRADAFLMAWWARGQQW